MSHDGGGTIDNRATFAIGASRLFSETGAFGFVNDTGGSVTNLGTFYYAGSAGKGFTQGAGTTTGNPVVIDSTLLAYLARSEDGQAQHRAAALSRRPLTPRA